jgi:hypothetical protein
VLKVYDLIFDSPKIRKILDKYANQINSMVPSAVFLARADKCSNERDYLEELIIQTPPTKQKDWLDRISSEDEVNHLSSWFEMMLYGWLRDLGEVEIEPEINGKRPDFCATILGNRIIFEARVRTETIHTSRKITVIGNEGTFPVAFVRFLDSEELKSLLKEKLNQHKSIYKLGYAYIICILCSVWTTSEQFKEALFGRECWIPNQDNTEIIDNRLDKSGLFCENEDLAKRATALLIFDIQWDNIKNRRVLRANYINNPFAEVKIDPSIFHLGL